MRPHFRYSPPRVSDNLVYGLVLAGVFGLVHWRGAELYAALLKALGPAGVFIGVGFGFYMLWFWLLGGLTILLDRRLDAPDPPGWLLRHRIQERAPGVARKGPSLGRAVGVVLFNQVLGTLPALVAVYFLIQWRGVDLSAAPPPIWRMGLGLVGLVLVEELLFYGVHRAMHQKALFRRFHRIHHEFKESIGIATHYVHFLEHLLGNLLPIFAGVLIFGTHPLTTFIWVGLAVTNAIHTHSGYRWPGLPWSVEHDFHHWNITGSYGAIGLLDRLLGTHDELAAKAREQA